MIGYGLWLAPLTRKSVWDSEPVNKTRNKNNDNNNNNNNYNDNVNDNYYKDI